MTNPTRMTILLFLGRLVLYDLQSSPIWRPPKRHRCNHATQSPRPTTTQASANPPSVPPPDSTPDQPKLTGYRLLVVSLTIGFGTAQAILTYQGHKFAPTTLAWISGIVITLFLAWVGWYENIRSYENLRYWLFERDYTSDIVRSYAKGLSQVTIPGATELGALCTPF
ncbi:hypothetical protein PAXRUDRAFT_825126 [Paxillus rubicundulus Ve08.2h10]|uniref:Uncharacterized protein n=1 Tax=Paxillus rubicundulus Ve08.2h10 TaxID=930991 RepID=A0A0D0DGS9_9AGAM|nr:hypothetical protein PAXRUDRAFT_825126 [Paxillus rubicundulus Ve08.2h10]